MDDPQSQTFEIDSTELERRLVRELTEDQIQDAQFLERITLEVQAALGVRPESFDWPAWNVEAREARSDQVQSWTLQAPTELRALRTVRSGFTHPERFTWKMELSHPAEAQQLTSQIGTAGCAVGTGGNLK